MQVNISKFQFIWLGFFTKNECEECGRGEFNWGSFKPTWGPYPKNKSISPILYYFIFGPIEIRYFPRKKL